MKKVTLDGIVTITFSDSFYIVESLKALKAMREINIQGDKKPVLEFSIAPEEGQTAEDVAFSWEPISYTDKQL